MKRIFAAVCLLLLFFVPISYSTDYAAILFENAAVFLTDGTNRLAINVDGSLPTDATIAAGSAVIVTDGTDDMVVNVDGSLNIKSGAALDVSAATVDVDGSGVTQPVSVAAALDCSAATVDIAVTAGQKIQITDGTNDAVVSGDGHIITEGPHSNAVHEGLAFIVSDIDLDVDTGGPKYWRLTTAATPAEGVHLVSVSIGSTTTGHVEIFENPTINAAGTGLAELNTSRPSIVATNVTTFYDTTTTGPNNDGTRIGVSAIGAGGKKSLGGGVVFPGELLLKPSEDYIFKFTPTADDAIVSLTLFWLTYE